MVILRKPIPNLNAPERFAQLAPVDSAFVCLKDKQPFDIELQYPKMQMRNAVTECYVHQEVFLRLLAAQKLLPQGYRLRIWDAWRPFALQKELYDIYAADLIRRFSLENLPQAQQAQIIAKYISFPNEDRLLPPVHTTGGAVDVTLVGPDGKALDMGTEFDQFIDETDTAHFEQEGCDTTIRDNRRLLYNAMTAAGFTNLPSEWWHYDYGDQMWAFYNNTPALYKGIFTQEELQRDETENRP